MKCEGASALIRFVWYKLTHFKSVAIQDIRSMKLKHVIIVSTLGAFALISSRAFAETYHFGEGQSSVSGGSTKHHSSAPKHRKHSNTRNTAS